MVTQRAKRIPAPHVFAEETSVSGVRRIELEGSGAAPPAADSHAELAEARAALERAQMEIAALRAQLDAKAAMDSQGGAGARIVVAAAPLDEPVLDDPALDEPALDEPALDDPALDDPALDEPFDGAATLRRVVVSEAPSSPESDDLRTATRYPCEFEVEFAHDTHFIAGVSSDMSTGGLFVATYQRVPVGSAVSVAFDLPNGHRVEARGEVRWTRMDEHGDSRPGIGIAFTALDEAALGHIVEFCRSRPPLCFEV